MKQLKKTLLTLVALLAVTTGAWADETLLMTINASSDFVSGSKTFDDKVTVTFSNSVWYGSEAGWYYMGGSLLTVAGTNGYTITSCKFYTEEGTAANGFTVQGESPSVYLSGYTVYTDANQSVNIGETGVTKIEVFGGVASAPSSGPEVAWDKAEKTGTFTMPGGNVTLEPEYYPQAALAAAPTAINDVPATTDGAIVSAGTVANIGETTTAQGTVMYYVSPTALDDAALLALPADQWTADVPTAAGLAQGQAHVYYYVRGNDSDTDDENFSDGDILAANAVTVTIAAEPTYAVTFAEGTEESDKWTASPNADVKKGETVTVTYTGSKKVIGVKAEKKAAVPVTAITLNKTETLLGVGNTETLSVSSVTPDNATDQTVTWSSDNTDVATVNATTGEVTAVAKGTANITATANDGSGVTATCAVTVTALAGVFVNGATLKMNNFMFEGIEGNALTITYNGTGFSATPSGSEAGDMTNNTVTVNGKKITVKCSNGALVITWVFDTATDHYTYTASGPAASEDASNAGSFLLNGTDITSQLTKD